MGDYKFHNCPCCRRACPVESLTCNVGKSFFKNGAAGKRAENPGMSFMEMRALKKKEKNDE